MVYAATGAGVEAEEAVAEVVRAASLCRRRPVELTREALLGELH
jgi:hypothetical protein